jgi:DNA-directed RNA polymerase II subunit RPB2
MAEDMDKTIDLQPGSFGASLVGGAPDDARVPGVASEGESSAELSAVPEGEAEADVQQIVTEGAAEAAAEPAVEELNTNTNAAFNYEFTVGEATEKKRGGLPQPFNDNQAQRLAAQLIHRYFTTQNNPLSRHHLESFDQFLQHDLPAILKANPIRLLKNPKDTQNPSGIFDYQVDVYIGGKSYDKLKIGVPTLVQGRGDQAEKRLLFPNEARLRNLTYSAPILADIEIMLKVRNGQAMEDIPIEPIRDFRILNMPIMLHSKYCILHNKPQVLLERMGECPQDPGGYFIIDGSEKVLITSQEQSFNTLWIKEQPTDEQCQYYANISCLNSVTRDVRSVAFYWTREKIQKGPGFSAPPIYKQSVLEVSIPDVLKPIPIFVLFRALGIETDKEILETIFSDLESPEAIDLGELLLPSINAATPFMDSYSAMEYIRLLTKTQNVNSVLDVLYNKLFCHVKYAILRRNADGRFVDEKGMILTQQQLNTFVKSEQASRITFLADCVRKILRVVKGYDQPASRDDTRNQRLLTSGFLCQQLFQHAYKEYVRSVKLAIDSAYAYNEKTYEGKAFANIFDPGSRSTIFAALFLTEQMIKGFKGQWQIGVSKKSEGVLQELSRLSYLDFISHLRRAVLDFDTSMKLVGPRRLHTSQYGYFCTSETPSGANIGIVKNLTIMTAISTSMLAEPLIQWLTTRGQVVPSYLLTNNQKQGMIPVFVNNSVIGYVGRSTAELTSQIVNDLMFVLKSMKRSGHLPAMCSVTFDRFERKVSIFTDEGRPCRPLIICQRIKVKNSEGVELERASLPVPGRFGTHSTETKRLEIKPWRELIVGTLETRSTVGIYASEFIDPFNEKPVTEFKEYIEYFKVNEDKLAVIEYLDPYEQNMALIANFPDHIEEDTTHMEVHPSTILGLLGNCIPYPNHNQSPRNQLSASQSKQGISLYATNWQNRFDNTANVLCYGEAPLVRTLYQDYFGDGKMPYGQNIILAIGTYGGYNQEDGIIMNKDALDRGQFRSINYRSYETREEEESLMTRTSYAIAHPSKVSSWLDLKPGLDYSKLDPETGIIKEGMYVTSDTVLVGRYSFTRGGQPKDASLTPQVFTTGLVEKVVVVINNMGKRLVKVRVVQDRVPVLGDKFSNRHGQKGTLNISYRGHDMPRTADGIIPDMIMNPTAIPSRMTMGQILEQIMGLTAANVGGIANATAFMNNGSPHPDVEKILEHYGIQKVGNQVLYNGVTGEQIEADIYMGMVYGMRLKHMTIDKINSRGQGRKEMKTRQPTGGRGNEGGLKIGEMDRDSILAHGVASFMQESMMLRSDASTFVVCNGCGTIPIYNVKRGLYMCPMCDGPIQYSGDTADTLEPIPPPAVSQATFSRIEIPYASKLLIQELETFLNMGLRILTTGQVAKLHGMETIKTTNPDLKGNLILPDPGRLMRVPVAELEEKEPTPASTAAELTQAREASEAASTAVDQSMATVATVPNEGKTTPFTGGLPTAPSQAQAQSQAGILNAFGPATAQPQLSNMGTTLQQGPASPIAAAQPSLAATITSVPATAPSVNGPAPELVAANQVEQQRALDQGLPPPPPLSGGGPPAELVPGTTIPVISIDTSEPALAADGLGETAPDTLPTLGEAYRSANRAPSTRRLPRRQPSPQPAYTSGPSEPSEPSASHQPRAPVRVIKEG